MNYAWAADGVSVGVNTGALHAIMSANIVVQLTLICLLVMSVMSWAIIYSKRKQFKDIDEADAPFEDIFWKASSLDDVYDKVAEFPGSSMAKVFRAGYSELRKMADSNLAVTTDDSQPPMLSGIDNLERALSKAIDAEVSNIETRLGFLATTGSTGPFIGLFGTVWGIMGSFQKIGATGMASLAVVAPGIAEALIATGIGLFAAIPATVGYNLYLNKLKKHEIRLNNFASDFLHIAKRNFFKES